MFTVGHIPAGKADTLPLPSNYMDQIFKRYDNTIAAKFFGHSHKDQFEIGYTDYTNQTLENALGISFISGAMTPTSESFRLEQLLLVDEDGLFRR